MRIHELPVPTTPHVDTIPSSDCGPGDDEGLLRRDPSQCDHLWIPTTDDGTEGCPFCSSQRRGEPVMEVPDER